MDYAHKFNGGSGPGSLVTGHEATPVRWTIDLDGQAGADNYEVNTTQSTDYVVNVHDTGAPDDGADVLTINGTANPDVFLLRSGFVASLQPNTGADAATNPYLQTYERVNYDDSVNVLRVNGGAGADHFYSDDNAAITTLDGGAGDDTFQFGQVFGSARDIPNVSRPATRSRPSSRPRLPQPRHQLPDGGLRRHRRRHLPGLLRPGRAAPRRRRRRRHLHHPRLRAGRPA